MAATRRSFFRWMLGAAAAAPALPAMAEAFAAAPRRRYWQMCIGPREWRDLIRVANIETTPVLEFRGIPIRVVDAVLTTDCPKS